MKVLVTGGNGFIGSHLAEYLTLQGCQVRCLLQRGDPLPPVPSSDAYDWVEGDLTDPASLEKATENRDLVFHVAAISRYHAGLPDEDYQRVNVQGTRLLLNACQRNQVKRCIYVSSIEAVGLSQDGRPLTEDSVPHPRNIYGRSKLEAEQIVQSFVRDYGMDCVIVRIATTYGPRELMIFKRIFKPISNGIYCLFGDGSALIEFAYIKNQVRGIWEAAQKGKAGQIYFISDGRAYSFKEVIQEIAAAMGGRLHLIHLPLALSWIAGACCEGLSKVLRFYPFYVKETGRPPFSRETLKWAARSAIFCDTTKAKTELGHHPLYSLHQGIQETVQWYRAQGWL